MKSIALVLTAAALCMASPATAQNLVLQGPASSKTITPAQFAALPHVKVRIEQRGRVHVYEGVGLLELLTQVGAPWGDLLTGKDMIDIVLATAKDGYKVVYSIGEIDPGTAKGHVLVVDRIDGVPLDAQSAPFEIVTENDLRPGRWLRMVSRLELVQIK